MGHGELQKSIVASNGKTDGYTGPYAHFDSVEYRCYWLASVMRGNRKNKRWKNERKQPTTTSPRWSVGETVKIVCHARSLVSRILQHTPLCHLVNRNAMWKILRRYLQVY